MGKKGLTKTLPMRELEAHGINYEPLQQTKEQFTAEGVASDLGVPTAQVVKAMLVQFQGDRGRTQFALFVTPGDCRLSLKKVKSTLKDKDAALASEKDVERITGFRVGAVSTLGFRRSDIERYLDQRVFDLKQVVISSGRPDLGLALSPADLFTAMEETFTGDYCEA
jgi:Cys-tRNA(Pro)/Cys-tRNA(Cys) deacylase